MYRWRRSIVVTHSDFVLFLQWCWVPFEFCVSLVREVIFLRGSSQASTVSNEMSALLGGNGQTVKRDTEVSRGMGFILFSIQLRQHAFVHFHSTVQTTPCAYEQYVPVFIFINHCSTSQISRNAPIISFWRDSTKKIVLDLEQQWFKCIITHVCSRVAGWSSALIQVAIKSSLHNLHYVLQTKKKHSYGVVEMCNIEFLKLHIFSFCIEKTCSVSPWRGGHCETCNESKVTSPELKKAFIPICCGSQNTQNTEERNISSMSQTSQPQVNACLFYVESILYLHFCSCVQWRDRRRGHTLHKTWASDQSF